MHIPDSSLRCPTALNELPSDFNVPNFGGLLPEEPPLPPPGLKFEYTRVLQGPSLPPPITKCEGLS